MGWFVPLALAAGGTGLGLQMKGQYEAGKAAESQAKSQAAWDEYNAELAEREAVEQQEAAAYEEKKHRKAGERLKATQRAKYAKAGVTFEGSPFEKLEQTASELEMGALTIRRSGMVGAQRLTSEAMLSRMSGRSALLRGRAARRASYWKMASTATTGGAQLGYQYGSMKGKW